MASLIAWLDASSEEERQMREVIKLFTEAESREELGLGLVRDAVSDGLFPGSSTLHTRARYYLFIPWAYKLASKTKERRFETVQEYERKLIRTMKAAGTTEGLIGSLAGENVKSLPSVLYWSALQSHKILTDKSISRADAVKLHNIPNKSFQSLHSSEGEERESFVSVWRSGIPAAPQNFPNTVPDGFNLTIEEAEWLRERIIDAAPDSLQAHLLNTGVNLKSQFPWEDENTFTVKEEVGFFLRQAKTFSTIIHGAQLLYNLLIAESYTKYFPEGSEIERAEIYREALADWTQKYLQLPNWSDLERTQFFDWVTKIRNGNRPSSAQRFINSWTEMLSSMSADEVTNIADNEDARKLIIAREISVKKDINKRIDNPKRLQHWGGSSGAGQFKFRWNNVKVIINDIQEGLKNSHA